MRNKISACIYIFAAVMLSSLIISHVLPTWEHENTSALDSEVLAMQWRNIDEWSLLRRNNEVIGASHLSIQKQFQRLENPPSSRDYLLSQNMELKLTLPLIPLPVPILARINAGLNRDFQVEEFALNAAVQSFSLTVEGFVEKKTLYFRVINARNTPPLYGFIPLKAPLSILPAVEPLVSRHFDLTPGKTYTIPVVDPLSGGVALKAKIRVVSEENLEMDGETVDSFRLETRLGELKKFRWVDGKGTTLRAEVFNNVISEKSSGNRVSKIYPNLLKPGALPTFDTVDFKTNANAAGALKPAAPGGGQKDNALTPEMAGQILASLLKGM